jgi:hypothetical protein
MHASFGLFCDAGIPRSRIHAKGNNHQGTAQLPSYRVLENKQFEV